MNRSAFLRVRWQRRVQRTSVAPSPSRASLIQLAVRLLSLATFLVIVLPAIATPPNDDFTSPSQIAGSTVDVRVSNLGATAQAGEPRRGNLLPKASVWYVWNA